MGKINRLIDAVEQCRTRRGVTLMLELIECKYDQVQAFKKHVMNQASLYFWKQLLTYVGVLVADAMNTITNTSWHL